MGKEEMGKEGSMKVVMCVYVLCLYTHCVDKKYSPVLYLHIHAICPANSCYYNNCTEQTIS